MLHLIGDEEQNESFVLLQISYLSISAKHSELLSGSVLLPEMASPL